MSPREVGAIAQRVGKVGFGIDVNRLRPASSTRITVPAPVVVHARLGARITVAADDLTPSLIATIKHAATMPNPAFYDQQRRRASTWNIPRFLRNYDETVAGDLVLPRGLRDRLARLVDQAGSRLDVTDERTGGQQHDFTLTGTLDADQHAAHARLTRAELGVLEAPPGTGKTVKACSLIATHGVSTLVLVNRKA